MQLTTTLKHTVVIGTISLLVGCAATQTAIEHRNLETNTKLSHTIFLDPVPPSQKTIYIAVKNTSTEALGINNPLKQAFIAQGYRVVNHSNLAHYRLQVNLLNVGKMSQSASQSALGGGYGSALAGAGTGAALVALGGGNGHHWVAGGIAGGLVGLAADSLVKDVNYTLITDVQISERVGKGVSVHEQFQANLSNGAASGTYQTSNRQTQYQRYKTRIVSNVDKVNLKFTQARASLEQGLVTTLVGIF